LNKFYGEASRSSLWQGQKNAIIATHGDDAKTATEPLVASIRHWCEYSSLNYAGIYSVRDEEGLASFQAEAAINGAKDFALRLIKKV
jgi:hypothetical protein